MFDKFNDELAEILDANLIKVNHRYYEHAIPENPDYKFLTIEQAATDLHELVTIMKDFYPNSKWISTGVSKGGMTAVYFRRFYPVDVDITIPRVAPTFTGQEDKRLNNFLNDGIRKEEMDRFVMFTKDVLSRTDEITPMLSQYIRKDSNLWKSLEGDEIIELLLNVYFFEYWKNKGIQFMVIPEVGASPKRVLNTIYSYIAPLLEYFDDINGRAYYYQVFTELGMISSAYPEIEFRHNYNDIIKKMYDISDIPEYDPKIMSDINNWVEESGDKIIYLYGELDPYSSCQFKLGNNTNVEKFIIKGQSHALFIKQMDEYEKFYAKLTDWMN